MLAISLQPLCQTNSSSSWHRYWTFHHILWQKVCIEPFLWMTAGSLGIQYSCSVNIDQSVSSSYSLSFSFSSLLLFPVTQSRSHQCLRPDMSADANKWQESPLTASPSVCVGVIEFHKYNQRGLLWRDLWRSLVRASWPRIIPCNTICSHINYCECKQKTWRHLMSKGETTCSIIFQKMKRKLLAAGWLIDRGNGWTTDASQHPDSNLF